MIRRMVFRRMNEPEERVAALLRVAGERIDSRRDFAPLVERVLESATDSFLSVGSPLGRVFVAAGPEGVRYLAPASSPEEFVRSYRGRFGRVLSDALGSEMKELAGRVEGALAGERADVPLDFSETTPFQRRVLEIVKGIPHGEARPYAWVAREAGSPDASRAVGNVMANNPVPLLVPCHRVVKNDGRTGSYAFGAGEKERLLEQEGVSPEELLRAPYVGTPTTGTVCHATCRNARRIHPENRCPFRSVAQAVTAGFRPCRVCRPVVAA
jgi:O-6-methylguanine DNA methyltransferase